MQCEACSRLATAIGHSTPSCLTTEGIPIINAHEQSVEELGKTLKTDVETGLTAGQVKECQEKKEKEEIDPEEDVIMAQVRRNGCLEEIPAPDLLVGDIVEVKLKGPLKGYIFIESKTLKRKNYNII